VTRALIVPSSGFWCNVVKQSYDKIFVKTSTGIEIADFNLDKVLHVFGQENVWGLHEMNFMQGSLQASTVKSYSSYVGGVVLDLRRVPSVDVVQSFLDNFKSPVMFYCSKVTYLTYKGFGKPFLVEDYTNYTISPNIPYSDWEGWVNRRVRLPYSLYQCVNVNLK
jgi:hypothetical protein